MQCGLYMCYTIMYNDNSVMCHGTWHELYATRETINYLDYSVK